MINAGIHASYGHRVNVMLVSPVSVVSVDIPSSDLSSLFLSIALLRALAGPRCAMSVTLTQGWKGRDPIVWEYHSDDDEAHAPTQRPPPSGFRVGHGGDLACPHRDCSCCDDCASSHAEIVDVHGQHYWVADEAERAELRS